MRRKVFISTSSFAEHDSKPIEMLESTNLEVELNPHRRMLSREEIINLVAQTEGLIAGTEVLDAEVLEHLKCLKVISRCGAGIDNVDLEVAKKLGIEVLCTPYGPTNAVAELVVAMIMSLLRHIPCMDREMRMGKWHKKMGHLIQGKQVGIIGYGKIGQRVAELLIGLGVDIAYCDPVVDKGKSGCRKVEMPELLSWADIVTVHASGKKTVLGDDELRQMKKGSWLINCARGGVVDERALYRLLKEGWLSGAALDVFKKEPYEGPLSELDNVIITPHIGSYAVESRVEMEVEAAQNLLKGLGL